MTVDAIIIGSGPGGSAAANVLTQAGWTVVIMEKGRNHLLDPNDLTQPASDYSNDEIGYVHRHFLGPDPFLEPRTFRPSAEDGDRTHSGDISSVPSTVGGGGPHADGKVPRFREDDFRLLSTFGPQPDADVVDWPITYDDLEPYYAEVERSIGVSGTADANPFASWRSAPYPMPAGASMYGATLTGPAAERFGFHPYLAPTAANSVPYDGRPACNNCGFCAFFGCPVHAKGDPLALLQRTMATGLAELLPETFVSRIRTAGGKTTGVDFIGPDGVERSMEARHVVVAGGAIETPRLLLLSGIGNDLVGKYVMFHFQTIVAGSLPERLHGQRGRAVTHVHDDAMVGDELSRAAAKDAGLPWMRGGLVEHATPSLPIMEAKLYPWGRRHPDMMKQSDLREHLAAFVMQGEDLAYPGNRVDLDPTVRDVRGFPVARVTYRGARHEHAVAEHYGPRFEEILQSLGASWTSRSTSPGIANHGGESPIPESRHVMGTTRMGTDPETSVVDSWGRVHGLENVVIADSSVFATSAGYGPTLTLVALAARAAAAMSGTELPATQRPS